MCAGEGFLASSLVAPAFDVEQSAIGVVDEGLVDEVMRLKGAHGVAAEAAFKDVDAPEFLSLFEDVGDAAKVVVPAAARLRPLHAVPLQKVVGHQVALLVGGGTVHVPAPASEAQHDD